MASSSAIKSSFTIGNLTLKSNVFLSPLESVSCVGFRHLCAKNGAGLTFTEMIRGQAVARNNNSALDLIDTFDDTTPTGLQLLVKSGDELRQAINRIEELSLTTRPHFKNICVVDLNFGCPSKDIINEGAGPALLKRKSKLLDIFTALTAWKKGTSMNVKAVGVKIRLGLNNNEEKNEVYMGVMECANTAGLDYITVHGRNASQRSRDPANWAPIREMKQIAQMPLLGNGDLTSYTDIVAMHELTTCDGFMVARAAIANPWVFRSMTSLSGDSFIPTSAQLESTKEEYDSWTLRAGTKEKFVSFHRENFSRINSWCNGPSGSRMSVVYPKNKHISQQ